MGSALGSGLDALEERPGIHFKADDAKLLEVSPSPGFLFPIVEGTPKGLQHFFGRPSTTELEVGQGLLDREPPHQVCHKPHLPRRIRTAAVNRIIQRLAFLL